MGEDISGIVLQVGWEVKDTQIGDEAFGAVLTHFALNNLFQAYSIFDPAKIVLFGKIPEKMSFVQAAAAPIAAGTSYQLVTAYSNFNSDSNVSILGAGTSVGLFGLQFVKIYYGAKNVVVTCSEVSSNVLSSYQCS